MILFDSHSGRRLLSQSIPYTYKVPIIGGNTFSFNSFHILF